MNFKLKSIPCTSPRPSFQSNFPSQSLPGLTVPGGRTGGTGSCSLADLHLLLLLLKNPFLELTCLWNKTVNSTAVLRAWWTPSFNRELHSAYAISRDAARSCPSLIVTMGPSSDMLLHEREKTTVKPHVSDHQKCEELVTTYKRWSLARIILKQGKINV